MSRPRAATWVNKKERKSRNIIKCRNMYSVSLIWKIQHYYGKFNHFHEEMQSVYLTDLYFCWPLWPPEWGIFLIWTGSGPPLGLAGSGRRGCWCRRSPPDTGSPPRRRHLSWSPQKPESTSPCLMSREKRQLTLIVKRRASYHATVLTPKKKKLILSWVFFLFSNLKFWILPSYISIVNFSSCLIGIGTKYGISMHTNTYEASHWSFVAELSCFEPRNFRHIVGLTFSSWITLIRTAMQDSANKPHLKEQPTKF